MKDWFLQVLQGLVKHPGDIVIKEKVDEMGVLLTISANKEDLGVLIGRKGEHINALRVLLRTHGHLSDIKASVKIESE